MSEVGHSEINRREHIALLIVDDHPVVSRGVRALLEHDARFEVKGTASNGKEAIRAVEELQPDVVLMDIVMPGMDGIEAARHIKASYPDTKIMFFTGYAEAETLYRAISAGADGYLLKDASESDIVEAVRSVHEGRKVLHPDSAEKLMRGFTDLSRKSAEIDEKLTPREREVIELVACGLTNGEIGARLGISDKTVKTHFSSILHKLNLQHRTQAVLYVLNRGQRRTASSTDGGPETE